VKDPGEIKDAQALADHPAARCWRSSSFAEKSMGPPR
jgi:hypothetical protein